MTALAQRPLPRNSSSGEIAGRFKCERAKQTVADEDETGRRNNGASVRGVCGLRCETHRRLLPRYKGHGIERITGARWRLRSRFSDWCPRIARFTALSGIVSTYHCSGEISPNESLDTHTHTHTRRHYNE